MSIYIMYIIIIIIIIIGVSRVRNEEVRRRAGIEMELASREDREY